MPSTLGRYAVRRRIGAGGFATVWLAYDEQLDSPVAVKVLADNWTEDAQVRQRFTEEGRYLRRVDSPYVVTVHDAGELDDGRPYLVMTYADQGTLADRLELSGLTVGQSLVVLRQVATGLQALHDQDILHRDVKPANVLFRTGTFRSDKGEVRAMLGDLGLGKALDVSSRLTMVAGTPSFVAPEQAQAEALDARADQYSLAALTFLLLTGRPPYSHTSLTAAADPAPPPPMSTPERSFPAAVEAVVRRGLARDREDRYDSVTDFADALEAAVGAHDADGTLRLGDVSLPFDRDLTQPGARPTPRPTAPTAVTSAPRPPRARRGRRLLVGAGVGVLCLAGLAAGGVGGYAAQHAHRPADVEVGDQSGYLSVTVPSSWDRATSTGAWQPPESQAAEPALSVGTTSAWNAPAAAADGVFVTLLPGGQLPTDLPRHPECASAGDPVRDKVDGDPSITATSSGCGAAAVSIERVVRVSDSQLLWVQVRSRDRGVATRVLDDVATHGI